MWYDGYTSPRRHNQRLPSSRGSVSPQEG
jgi:hypothetical protein